MRKLRLWGALSSVLLSACSASPPPEPKPKPPPRAIEIARPSGEPNEASTPAARVPAGCELEAAPGTRCGDQAAGYCFDGKCLTREQCAAACKDRANGPGSRCLDRARAAICPGSDACDENLDFMSAAMMCGLEMRRAEQDCRTTSCDLDPEPGDSNPLD